MSETPTIPPTPETILPDETPEEELARLRAEEHDRQEAEAKEEEARELEELRLVSTLSREGKRSVDFEVVNTPYGVFGVRKPDAQGIAQFDKAVAVENPSVVKIIGILRNYILPTSKALEFHKIAQERPGIATGENSVATAFRALTGATRYKGKKNY